jgi:hypothetical protein
MSIAALTASRTAERPNLSRFAVAVARWVSLRQKSAEIAVGRHLASRLDEDLRRLGLTDAEITVLRQTGRFRRLGG